MAQRPINLGTPPRGTDGDTVRQANEKINANFAELYATKQDGIEGLTQAGIEFLQAGDGAEQREVIGLDQVNNTSDLAKPVSTDQQAALDGKVDKVPGKGLSENDFTDELYDKLSGIEGTHFRGQFISLEALQAAIPSANIGDYANIDPGEGQDVQRALWDSDDADWVISGSGGGQMTPAQIKTGLLANPDTNVLTDAQLQKLIDTLIYTQGERTKLAGIADGAQANYPAMDQPTAEGGTNTSLLSVSALRIRQAILAWWRGSDAKTKLDTLPAAPIADGKTYALKDRSWAEFQASGSALIKETYYRTPGAISHVMDNMTSVYEVEVWGGGGPAGQVAGSVVGGTTIFGGVSATGGNNAGGDPGIGSGGLENLRGARPNAIGSNLAPIGGAAPRSGFGQGTATVPESPGVGGSTVTSGYSGGCGGGYALDRKAIIGGSTVTGSVGAGGIPGGNGGPGAPGMILVREYSSSLPGVDIVNQIIEQLPKHYSSPQTTWVAGGELIFNHGLGAIPRFVQIEAICTVAVGATPVGTRFKIDGIIVNAGLYRQGQATLIDSSQVRVRMGTSVYRCASGSGADEFSPSNCQILLKAML